MGWVDGMLADVVGDGLEDLGVVDKAGRLNILNQLFRVDKGKPNVYQNGI